MLRQRVSSIRMRSWIVAALGICLFIAASYRSNLSFWSFRVSPPVIAVPTSLVEKPALKTVELSSSSLLTESVHENNATQAPSEEPKVEAKINGQTKKEEEKPPTTLIEEENRVIRPNCKFGLATSIAPRFTKTGEEIEYWAEMLNNVPLEITHISVLSRLPKAISHPRVTVFHQSWEPQPDYDSDFLGRPILQRYNDSPSRIKWRSSLSLDLARLVRYVGEHCRYVLWIEDDAILPNGWLERVKQIMIPNDNWAFDFICKSGIVGAIFNSKHLLSLTQYIIHHFDNAPVDWTVETWMEFYRKKHPNMISCRRFSIIGHRGLVSSLDEAGVRPVFGD